MVVAGSLLLVVWISLSGPGIASAHADRDSESREADEDRREAWEDYYEARDHAHRGHFRRALDEIDEALEELPQENRFRLT